MNPQTPETAETPAPIYEEVPKPSNGSSFRGKLSGKNLRYIILGIVVFVLFASFLLYAFLNKSTQKNETADANTKAVEKDKNYQTYLQRETELYPREITPEVKDMLTQKVLDDQIILESAKKEGIIKDFPESENMATNAYLQRTEQVDYVKTQITKNENSLEGELVSIWFYNNGKIGPQGYEKSKQLALTKITALYNRVKKKDITMKQAGDLIAKDKSIAVLDEAYIENSYTYFHFSAGHPITFWKPFDDQLIQLKPGEISEVYLGDSFSPDGKPARDGVYVFGTITKRTDTATYNSFDNWLKQQKEIAKKSSFIPNFLSSVFAQEDNNQSNCCAIDESLYSAKCGHGCPPFKGIIRSKTGAPMPNVIVTLTNKLNESQETKTDEKGEYYFEAVGNFSCGTSPMRFSALDPNAIQANNYKTPDTASLYSKVTSWIKNSNLSISNASAATPTTVCDVVSLPIGNLVSLQQPPAVTCGLAPSEVAQPPITASNPLIPAAACGQTCANPADCTGAENGCTSCLPDASGKKVCSSGLTCGSSCQKNEDCDTARDSCNACVSGKCAAFDQNLCGCDGFDGVALSYPGQFTFDAYAKVLAANAAKAEVKGIQFKLSESDKSDPNGGTIIAQSELLSPEIVSSTADKVRYKATWNMTPPQIKADKVYRVFSEIKCRPKSSSQANAGSQLQSKVMGISEELQLTTVNFIKKGPTDSCKFLFFEYNDGQITQ